MRNHTLDNTKLALLCGAVFALGLTACNREKAETETPPASTAGTAATTEPMPTDTMAATSTMSMPPSAVTSAADVTAEAPPSDGLGEPPSAMTASDAMDNKTPTDETQPPADANNPTK